jgi:hypothetical protein
MRCKAMFSFDYSLLAAFRKAGIMPPQTIAGLLFWIGPGGDRDGRSRD